MPDDKYSKILKDVAVLETKVDRIEKDVNNIFIKISSVEANIIEKLNHKGISLNNILVLLGVVLTAVSVTAFIMNIVLKN